MKPGVAQGRAFEQRVINLARACGWAVWHHADSRRQIRPGVFVGDRDAAGLPDLLLVHPERRLVLFRELKFGTARLSQSQLDSLAVLLAAGADAAVWRYPDDWQDIVHVLGDGRVAA